MDQDAMRAHVHPRFPALIDAVMVNHCKTDRTRRASPMAPSMEVRAVSDARRTRVMCVCTSGVCA